MTEETFTLMRDILGAPSPVGYEGAMTFGVVEPYFEKTKLENWKCVKFVGNASIVLDTDPGATDKLSIMVVGHADKIRCHCLLYTSPSPRDQRGSRMPSSA